MSGARSLFFAPGDWMGSRFTARGRRAAAAWLLLASLFVATPLTYAWKDAVWMVWLLSMAAIWVSLATIVTTETPVEHEDAE